MGNDDWAAALAEADDPNLRDAGLWARCFTEADGDENKAKAAYVKHRVGQNKSAPAQSSRNHGYCPSCNYEVSLNADACPNCKAIFSDDGWKPTLTPQGNPKSNRSAHSTIPEPKKSGGMWKWVVGVPIGLIVVFLGFGAIVGNSPDGKARASDKDAIDYCWSEQSRKSLDPASARFVAQTCEKMQDDYRTRWGRSP